MSFVICGCAFGPILFEEAALSATTNDKRQLTIEH
jgi:hypothetical protein